MAAPFILRFEEALPEQETSSVPITMGTRTETYTAKEGSDSDRTFGRISTIPARSAVPGGTQTMTNVEVEAADADPGSQSLLAIPR